MDLGDDHQNVIKDAQLSLKQVIRLFASDLLLYVMGLYLVVRLGEYVLEVDFVVFYEDLADDGEELLALLLGFYV